MAGVKSVKSVGVKISKEGRLATAPVDSESASFHQSSDSSSDGSKFDRITAGGPVVRKEHKMFKRQDAEINDC